VHLPVFYWFVYHIATEFHFRSMFDFPLHEGWYFSCLTLSPLLGRRECSIRIKEEPV
jgi:hypothetical protein